MNDKITAELRNASREIAEASSSLAAAKREYDLKHKEASQKLTQAHSTLAALLTLLPTESP